MLFLSIYILNNILFLFFFLAFFFLIFYFIYFFFFFFQAEDGIRDKLVTGVQTCALAIGSARRACAGSQVDPRETETSRGTLDMPRTGAPWRESEISGPRNNSDAQPGGSESVARRPPRPDMRCGRTYNSNKPPRPASSPDTNSGCPSRSRTSRASSYPRNGTHHTRGRRRCTSRKLHRIWTIWCSRCCR